MFQLVNLFGICLFPTLVIYLASNPLFICATLKTFSYFDMIVSFIILLGTALELIIDLQMKRFIKRRSSRNRFSFLRIFALFKSLFC